MPNWSATGAAQGETRFAQNLSKPTRRVSSELCVLPGDEDFFDPAEEDGGSEAYQGDHHQADIHLFHLEDLPAGPDEITDATFGADELRGHDDQQCDAHAEFHTSQDERQGAREGSVGEHHQPTGMEVLADVQVDLFDVAHTRDG